MLSIPPRTVDEARKVMEANRGKTYEQHWTQVYHDMVLAEAAAERGEQHDVLVVRTILHAHQRAMTPPDSGWGNMSYIKGSYDHLPTFKAALAAYRALNGGGSPDPE